MPLLKKILPIFKKRTLSSKKPINKSNSLVFTPYFEKRIDPKQIDVFWNKYFSGKFKSNFIDRTIKGKQNYISDYNSKLLVFNITPTVLGTVRKIPIIERSYFNRYSSLKRKVSNIKLKNSELVLFDLLSIKKQEYFVYALERIFPSISIRDFYLINNKGAIQPNRYSSSFLKTLKESGLSKIDFSHKLSLAYKEVENNKRLNSITGLDINPTNVIILEYNKVTGKFKFGLIDLLASHLGSL